MISLALMSLRKDRRLEQFPNFPSTTSKVSNKNLFGARMTNELATIPAMMSSLEECKQRVTLNAMKGRVVGFPNWGHKFDRLDFE